MSMQGSHGDHVAHNRTEGDTANTAQHGNGSSAKLLSTSRSAPQRGSRKLKGLTCANCRLRKVRCEGSHPTCKTCEAYHDECRYDKAPPLSQIVAMAKRLQQAEETIAALRERSSSGGEDAMDLHHGPLGFTSPPRIVSISSQSPQSHPAMGSAANTVTDFNTPIRSGATAAMSTMEPHSNQQSLGGGSSRDAPAVAELSIDKDGKVNYYGPTSAVHDPASMENTAPSVFNATSEIPNNKPEIRSYLLSYTRESEKWEDFAIENAALQTGIPRQLVSKLLRLHWTWVSPMFMWVYRPAFIRDMITNGYYYSDFLLTVICAHTAKYEDPGYAEFLLSRSRRLLGEAIQQPSSVPTIQALLQLSARDFAHGSISQGWVCSGIAFRMASDLGLQHNCTNIKGLTPVDWEVRRRLFWSCYLWDKVTSLYTGRFPAITEKVDLRTLDLLDDSADEEPWNPFGQQNSFAPTQPTPDAYPTIKKHAVSCFVNSCRLSTIINDVIVQLYSRQNEVSTEVSLQNIQGRLDLWRAQLPTHLICDPDNLPSICPPPHIISQNILFFATIILANRPLWSAPSYYQKCITAAHSMGQLVLLLESTIGLSRITYLMCYSVYTGASAVVEDARNGSGAAHTTLQVFLRALKAGVKTCPLVERSLSTIFNSLNRPPPPDVNADTSAQHNMANTNGVVPAFPYVDFSETTYLPGMIMDPKDMLNCYPELNPGLDDLITSPLL